MIKPTVLLVDDEPSIRRFISAALTQIGYSVLDAGSGEEGLKIFRKNKAAIGLVVTDVLMPEMSGFDLGDTISAESPHTPILYISGYEGETRRSATAPKKVLKKPFRIAELIQAVERLTKET